MMISAYSYSGEIGTDVIPSGLDIEHGGFRYYEGPVVMEATSPNPKLRLKLYGGDHLMGELLASGYIDVSVLSHMDSIWIPIDLWMMPSGLSHYISEAEGLPDSSFYYRVIVVGAVCPPRTPDA